MKIYNKNKTTMLESVDLENGYLKDDKLFIEHVNEKEIFHYEWFDSTTCRKKQGKCESESLIPEGARIIASEKIPEHDRFEQIKVYIEYTEEELARKARKDYEKKVEALIRERYTVAEEFAILRQRDTKQEEYREYNNYCETCKIIAKQGG